MKPKTLRYISHGQFETGGFRYETALFEALQKAYGVKGEARRRQKSFRGWWAHLGLLLWSFLKTRADINLVVVRCALPALWRNRFSNKQTLIVLHNYAPDDGKSAVLQWYYKRLFAALKRVQSPEVKLVVVSPFWKAYFTKLIRNPKLDIVVFPNLFDTGYYQAFVTGQKRDRIHLGQYSTKNDPAIFDLATQLHHAGWSCYFSTLNPADAAWHNGRYEVLYFGQFDAYLAEMAECRYTLALPRIDEGWNRIAHESILVGTPVIGYNRAGLGDLLQASGMFTVNTIAEAFTIITERQTRNAVPGFIKAYDLAKASEYIKPLV